MPFVGFRGDRLEIGLTPEQMISLIDYQIQMKITDEQLISRFEEVAPRAPQISWDPFIVNQ